MFESRKGNRDTRREFERDLNILKENMISGKIQFSYSIKKLIQDLYKVNNAPNKRINLNTVNEMVRSLAMSADFKSVKRLNVEEETNDE